MHASSPTRPSRGKIDIGFIKGQGSHGRDSVGVGVGMKEGKPLQMGLWGSGGAVVGCLAGPAGAAIGGGVGLLAGYLFSRFIQSPPPNEPGRPGARRRGTE